MKLFILYFTTLILVLPSLSKGQIIIYPTSKSYLDTNSLVKKFKKIQLSGNYFKTIDLEGNKSKIQRDSIWGYLSENDKPYRMWGKRALHIDTSTKFITIYHDFQDEAVIIGDVILSDSKKTFYFSSNLDNEIYPLYYENLKNVFNFTDAELVNLKRLDKKRMISKKNPMTNNYYITETLFLNK
ncbi:MAG: hypothetical protein LH629_11570 [Ignavibacteria bacterium]|nr:hypothetical protein [Ignavibacteria bacterium]